MTSEAVKLPDEVLLRIFGSKSPKELCLLALVSWQWRMWAEDKTLWKKFLQPSITPSPQVTYKKLYLFSSHYRLPQYRILNSEADKLLNVYLPLDRDKLIEFLTKNPKLVDYLLFHPNPEVIQHIDNIVLTHIAKIDKSKIITMVQHFDTRISIHLNRHLLIHFMEVSPEVTPHVLNHPHETVIKEINDKLLITAIEKDIRSKVLILAHTHPHIIRLRQAQVVQAKLAEKPSNEGCRIS